MFIFFLQESVLDHKLKDKVEDMSPGRMTFYNIPPDAVIKMESAKQQLEDAIMKYEQIIEEIEEIWESKVELCYLCWHRK